MKRRAFTLIEMVAVIAVSSAVMGVGVVMLAALLKSEGSSRRHLEYSKNINRLDEQFRADVHAAASFSMNEEGTSMELTMSEDSLSYICYALRLMEISREELKNGKMLRRESYPLPEEMQAGLGIKKEKYGDVLILHIEPKPTPGTKIHYPTTSVEAVVAKDRRFGQVEKQK
jgi:type II secretory pathway component PulJ